MQWKKKNNCKFFRMQKRHEIIFYFSFVRLPHVNWNKYEKKKLLFAYVMLTFCEFLDRIMNKKLNGSYMQNWEIMMMMNMKRIINLYQLIDPSKRYHLTYFTNKNQIPNKSKYSLFYFEQKHPFRRESYHGRGRNRQTLRLGILFSW